MIGVGTWVETFAKAFLGRKEKQRAAAGIQITNESSSILESHYSQNFSPLKVLQSPRNPIFHREKLTGPTTVGYATLSAVTGKFPAAR